MRPMNKRRMTTALAAVVALSLIAGSTYAAPKKKMLEAYSDISIEYNGTDLADADGPLLINNKTYIPLRMLMNYFGDKEINWDNDQRKVRIKNKQNPMEAMYMAQISSRNAQIAELEKQVKDLKAQLATAQTTAKELNLTKLKKALNADYEDYDNRDISITVSGDSEKIRLTVSLSKTDWTAMSSSRKSALLKNICNDIWDEAEDAVIEGTIKDSSKTLASFSVKPGKTISLEDGDPDFDTLATDLVKEYKGDWSTEGMVLALEITGTESRITYKVTMDYSKYDTKWEGLSSTKKKRLMDDLYDAVLDEYDDATVTGYLYDTKEKKNIAKYDGSKLTEY